MPDCGGGLPPYTSATGGRSYKKRGTAAVRRPVSGSAENVKHPSKHPSSLSKTVQDRTLCRVGVGSEAAPGLRQAAQADRAWSLKALDLTSGKTDDTIQNCVRGMYSVVRLLPPCASWLFSRPMAKDTTSTHGRTRGFRHRPVNGRPLSESAAAACAEEIVGRSFRNRDLLVKALTHSSIADTRLASNERLELLGDAVLGLVVCEELYRRFDDWLEGDLTKAKSIIVSRRVCAAVADEVGLTRLLILGNGIDARSTLPTSLRAAVYESVIGALFLDGGLEPAKNFILRSVSHYISDCAEAENRENHKSALQQYAQRELGSTPQYETLDEQGPDHSKCFEVCVVVAGERFPSAWGPNKKEAEQEAARRALDILLERDRLRSGDPA